ncbi:cysteine-rich CWC family protein [Teredinibacter turnerae]|uniref:cysteine-rich CWC family protein n=1 Tax=Teredinibacter turnerae TaxID=2426 RepID=UPI0005631D34|nr:cysteine-rich CWC family protein [Teredinibacter turnerae]
MPQHQTETCPRCQQTFECKMGSITLCHCSTVALNKAQRDYIAKRWDTCLCHACLLAIAADTSLLTPGVPAERRT